MKGGTNPASENPDVARNRSYEAERTRRSCESTTWCPLTNLVFDQGATLRAAGIERRASPVSTSPEAEPPVYRRRQHSNHGNRLETVASSGGVMTAARSEGLYRNR